MTDLNKRAKTTKDFQKKKGINLYDFGLGNGFLGETPKAAKEKQINWTPPKCKTWVLQRKQL